MKQVEQELIQTSQQMQLYIKSTLQSIISIIHYEKKGLQMQLNIIQQSYAHISTISEQVENLYSIASQYDKIEDTLIVLDNKADEIKTDQIDRIRNQLIQKKRGKVTVTYNISIINY
jgi:hypothetical protein